jgi:hypothetical protein
MADHWTDAIPDMNLKCLVIAARGLASRRRLNGSAWEFVGRLFYCGSTTAASICRRIGVDTEAKVKDIRHG